MALNPTYQIKIVSPDGVTTLYSGGIKLPVVNDVVSAESSATMLSAEAIIAATATVLNAPTASVGDEEQFGSRIAGVASAPLIGVTTDPILAGKRGVVAGIGCMVPVRTNGTAAFGTSLVCSSTAGQVTAAAAKAAGVPAYGVTLGLCTKANASIGGVNIAGVLISCPGN